MPQLPMMPLAMRLLDELRSATSSVARGSFRGLVLGDMTRREHHSGQNDYMRNSFINSKAISCKRRATWNGVALYLRWRWRCACGVLVVCCGVVAWSVATLKRVTVTSVVRPRLFVFLTTLTFRALRKNHIVSTAIEAIEKRKEQKQRKPVVHVRSGM